MPKLVVALALAALACASRPVPPAPAPLDPVGTYSFDTIFEGQPLSGKIYITGSAGAYGGEVVPDRGPPPVAILSVTVVGQELTIIGDAGGEELMVTMTFDGNRYSGWWAVAGDSGELTGVRLETP